MLFTAPKKYTSISSCFFLFKKKKNPSEFARIVSHHMQGVVLCPSLFPLRCNLLFSLDLSSPTLQGAEPPSRSLDSKGAKCMTEKMLVAFEDWALSYFSAA